MNVSTLLKRTCLSLLFFSIASCVNAQGLKTLNIVPVANDMISSSVTYSFVLVSTGTASRIDDAGENPVMQGRIYLDLTNHNTFYNLYYAFDSNVSTHTGSGVIGHIIKPEDTKRIPAPFNSITSIEVWAIAADGAFDILTVGNVITKSQVK